MVYDCFIFYNELDLLELRFKLLSPYVDKFVLVESRKTFTGIPKPAVFDQNKGRFNDYLDKVLYYCMDDVVDENNPWLNEYEQRSCLTTKFKFGEDDILFVTDVDEIPDVQKILNLFGGGAYRLNFNFYYYYFNYLSNQNWSKPIVGDYKTIKNINNGNRDDYENLSLLTNTVVGKHFSYLFGSEWNRYRNKVNSFSHEEYNLPYYTKNRLIKYRLSLGIDLFDRDILYKVVPVDSVFTKEERDIVASIFGNKFFYRKIKKWYWLFVPEYWLFVLQYYLQRRDKKYAIKKYFHYRKKIYEYLNMV